MHFAALPIPMLVTARCCIRLESGESAASVLQAEDASVLGCLLRLFLQELEVRMSISPPVHPLFSVDNLHSTFVRQEPLIPPAQRPDCLKLGRDSGALENEGALQEIVQWLRPLVSSPRTRLCNGTDTGAFCFRPAGTPANTELRVPSRAGEVSATSARASGPFCRSVSPAELA